MVITQFTMVPVVGILGIMLVTDNGEHKHQGDIQTLLLQLRGFHILGSSLWHGRHALGLHLSHVFAD